MEEGRSLKSQKTTPILDLVQSPSPGPVLRRWPLNPQRDAWTSLPLLHL